MASYGVESNHDVPNPSSTNFSESSKCVGNFHHEPDLGLSKRKQSGYLVTGHHVKMFHKERVEHSLLGNDTLGFVPRKCSTDVCKVCTK
jgi:hypothetical protein